jgi:uncharacterized protein (TIGR02001 family)
MLDHRKWFAPLLLLVSVCRADGLGGDVGVASDEVFRGLSQSDHEWSPQVDLHYSQSGWYAGLTALNVRRLPYYTEGAGLIGYLGYQYRLSDDWAASFAARHYDYLGYGSRHDDYVYDEGAVSLSWRELIVATVIAAPNVWFADFEGHHGRGAAYTYELGGRLPLAQGFCVNAGIGYYNLDKQIGTGYAYGSAGLSKQWRSVNFDLRYVGTDETAKRRFEQFAENRLVFSVLYLF